MVINRKKLFHCEYLTVNIGVNMTRAVKALMQTRKMNTMLNFSSPFFINDTFLDKRLVLLWLYCKLNGGIC